MQAYLAAHDDFIAWLDSLEGEPSSTEIDDRLWRLAVVAAARGMGSSHWTFVVDGLVAYGESDLLCYRADHPEDLVARQAAAWDPLLAWASKRYDVAFEVASGIVHRPQPTATLTRTQGAAA